MKLLVGLGNPGSRYAATRHNFGFMLLDRLCEKLPEGISSSLEVKIQGSWRERFGGQTVEGSIGGAKVLLLKPQTFMNLSGQSVVQAIAFYKLSVSDVYVAHDDLDTLFGSVRLKKGGGEAGHNGLRSISGSLGDPSYYRIRLGIGRPAANQAASIQGAADAVNASSEQAGAAAGKTAHQNVSDWVLSRFDHLEQSVLSRYLDIAMEATLSLMVEGLEASQRRFHPMRVTTS
jgi:aminoacyl-tRNA hydrolase